VPAQESHPGSDRPDELLIPRSAGSYQELRQNCPVQWTDTHGGYWLVSRYHDVRAVLTRPALFSSRQTLVRHEGSAGVGAIPLELDPPQHGAYRQLLKRLMATSRPGPEGQLAQLVVDEVLANARRWHRQDFIRDFVIPVTSTALFRFAGFPARDEAGFVNGVISFLTGAPAAGGLDDPADHATVFSQTREDGRSFIDEYVHDRISAGREATPGAFLDLLVSASWETQFGTPADEAASMLINLVEAGIVNTSAVLQSAAGHLAMNAGDREMLLAQPQLTSAVTEEMLRLYAPLHPVRTVRRDVLLAGSELHIGDIVMLLIGSADRDPELFDQPDDLVVGRAYRQHLAFGAGPHWCLGAALAEQILNASLGALGRVLQQFELPVLGPD
jgi:cytochrome P450